ncbi:MAG: hypothetical protein LC704_10805, partial [Actinobacteria bacterium]|nr:hypothetical protein [Actinomycetota bacterium]
MSDHWRLAIRGAAFMVALAVPVAAVILYFYGMAHAGAFLYGAATGILSFASTALTVSLMPVSSTAHGVVMWAGSFVARYGFAAAALGVPAFLGLWPAVAMLGGFAGVYLAENAVLLPG